MIFAIAKVLVGFYVRCFYSPEISGLAHLPKTGAYIVCANHYSYWDPVIIALYLNRRAEYIAKKELFNNPFLAWLFRKLGAFPVERDKADMKSFRHALQVLKDGKPFVIFAQGGRKKEIEAENAKQGVSLLAVKTGAPVVPCYVKKEGKIVRLSFGEPISFQEQKGKKLSKEEFYEINQSIMQRIVELRDAT